ncbi:MAG: ATPase, T2SS/T4P/T4SS family, partial [bacterium]
MPNINTRILIVNATAANEKALKQNLEQRGYRYLYFANGLEQVLENLNAGEINLLLYNHSLDLEPQQAFSQSINAIYEQWIENPQILVITDARSVGHVTVFKQDGIVRDILEKPFTVSELISFIERYSIEEEDKTADIIESRRPKRTYGRKTPFLGESLLKLGIIDETQLKKALKYQQQRKMYLGDALVALGYITEDQKVDFLSRQSGVPMASSELFTNVEKEVVGLIPEKIAVEKKLIALRKENFLLTVAMVDPSDVVALDHLRTVTKCEIFPLWGKLSEIRSAQTRYYQDISAEEGAHTLLSDLGEDVTYIEAKEDEISIEDLREEGTGQAIIKLVSMLIVNAIKEKASDIHIEPLDKKLLVRYRVDGDLREVMSPPKKSMGPIISRIKILSNLDIAERRLPQDGRMIVKMKDREVDVRVSILPTVSGEK